MTISKEVQFIIEAADNLPPLPETLTEVLRRSSDKDVSLKEIAGLIAHDVGLTARILKTANSAFYSPVEEIKSIESATARLGIDTIRNILLTLSLLDVFPRIYSEHYNQIFHSSIYTALAAEGIADKIQPGLRSDAFFTGLLLNSGRLLFLRYLEEKYIRVIHEAQVNNIDIRTAENLYLGIDFIKIGGLIAERWKLPSTVISTLNWYDQPDPKKNKELNETQSALIKVTRAARYAADFYLSWNKLQSHGFFLLEMKTSFSINGDTAIEMLKTLPKQFSDMNSALGINLKEGAHYDDSMAAALQELPAIRSRMQKMYSNYVHASKQLKDLKTQKPSD